MTIVSALAYLDPGPSAESAGPGPLETLIFLAVIGTTAWVFFDAPTRGLSRWWAGGFLLLWIVAFPWYLVARRRVTPAPAHVSMPPPSQVPTGGGWWDIDPQDATRERWREGGQWTDATRPRE